MESNNIIKLITGFILIMTLFACGRQKKSIEAVEMISDDTQQAAIFRSLVQLTNNVIPEQSWKDSLAFLILPVQASCPSCRNKTIDSIVKHQASLVDRHFIVISADGGKKAIGSFFRERDAELPAIENRLFLDSTNQAFQYGLYDNKPTIYYTSNGKAYKKVASLPETVKGDLHQFFSGKLYDN